jgi:hypothetical protein
MPVTIFLPHSTHDAATVAALRTALESYRVSVWADSRRLGPGEELPPRIQVATNMSQLGTVHLLQGHYFATLAAWTASHDTFAWLNEPRGGLTVPNQHGCPTAFAGPSRFALCLIVFGIIRGIRNVISHQARKAPSGQGRVQW